ncbi:UPF0764 protein C16orf89 homolog isoform X2 [Leptopilina boulardi]|uniref:UPF0764 protein C16orf89 homolog isoform X2 n=1 Tax=Leptopilina boulardi TaxID=63433 RepID=UPI0021F63498|nr:UPF0764 protein C16orf89 homolog isoform X2 [Leptopilina boulardi]
MKQNLYSTHISQNRQLKALQRVIDFMADRPEEMNIDAIFGLTLGEAHLISASSHSNVRLLTWEQKNNLKKLLKKCKKIRNQMKKILSIKSEIDSIGYSNLTDPIYWTGPIDWKSDFLKSTVPRKLIANHETIMNLLWNGRPNEDESDSCIVDTFKEVEQNICQITDDCEMMLSEDDNPQGFATTHRLLLIMVSKAFDCEELKKISSDKLIPKFCSSILQNLIDIERVGFPAPLPDLVMEEVLLCGAQGYLEFINDHWLNIILNWQEPSGCFSASPKTHKSRTRRSSNVIDFGCENHTTGLGVGTIALFIRHYIENANINEENYYFE